VLLKLANLIVYSNLWIAICAVSLTILSYFQFGFGIYDVNLWLVAFIFSSTILVYGIHRIQGLSIVDLLKFKGRFRVIRQFRLPILILTIIAGITAIISATQFPLEILASISIPGLISLLYVIPFYRGKRLRDFPGIKIFLVSGVWAYATTVPVFFAVGEFSYGHLIMILLERTLFIFAITVPFDIRDIVVDTKMRVLTLPIILGKRRSNILIMGALMDTLLLAFIHYSTTWIGEPKHWIFVAMVLVCGLTYLAIRLALKTKNDLYYSGLLDGTMLLFSGILIGAYMMTT